jgi:hypothetical protein
MTTEELEDALKSTFRSAALDAPEPPADLLTGVARRHRSRVRRQAVSTATAVVATLAVTGGTFLMLSPADEQPPAISAQRMINGLARSPGASARG